MTKNLKIFLGAFYLTILFVLLYFIFTSIEIGRLNDFSYYKEIQSDLDLYVTSNMMINLFYFFIFAIIWVALLGFGSPILIISGIIFGQWVGTIISVISISFGALLLYSIANFFFKDIIKNILKNKIEKYILLFKKNEFYYFFIYRLTGGLGVPFALQNLIPILFEMKKINYFNASLFGFIPSFFVMNTIGAGLNSYIEQADNFKMLDLLLTKEIYLPILMFFILMIFSFIIKNKFFDEPNR